MRIKNLFFMPALIACLGSMPAGRVAAQTFTTLHKFTGGSDGGNPWAALTLSGNTLYGTTYGGGDSGAGTMFAINTDGTGFTNLHSFRGGSDCANPFDGLILSGSTLYGTAAGGGSSGKGTVFAVNTNGTGFTNLHNFNGSDGSYPMAGLILSGNTLYGTTEGGASYGFGALFAINTDGTGFTNLHNFNANLNSDGGDPADGLVIFGNTLYGTTSYGGSSGKGTVFKVNTDGTGFTNLHSFAGYPSDGTGPLAGLFLSGNTLYGAGQYGGSSNDGTVFAINTDGTGFTNLFSFTGASDGEYPLAGLILSGNTLYGTA